MWDFNEAYEYIMDTYCTVGYTCDDPEDDFFECPECREPLLRADWPKFEFADEPDCRIKCPVCETNL